MKMKSMPVLGLVAALASAGCGASTEPVDQSAATAVARSQACASLAGAYATLLASDARTCDPVEAGSCGARRPVVGYQVPSGAPVEGTPAPSLAVAISVCPVASSGVAVNPGRTAALDAVFTDYVAAGCGTEAGPGCGAGVNPATGEPLPPVAAVCAQLPGDPAPRCH